MRTPPHSFFKTLFVLSTLMVLSLACSRMQLVYFFSEQMLLNRFDHYFDLNHNQEQFLEQKIKSFITWHKTKELSKVEIFLSNFNERFRSSLTQQDISWILQESKILWTHLIGQSIPSFAEFLTTINEKQIEYLKPKLEKRNQFLIDLVEMDDEELIQNSQDWLIQLLEDWINPLTLAQEEQIRDQVRNNRSWFESRIQEGSRFNQILLGWLKYDWSAGEIQTALLPWVVGPESAWTTEFRKQVEIHRLYWINMALFIDSLLTPEQREQVLNKTQSYIDGINRYQANS